MPKRRMSRDQLGRYLMHRLDRELVKALGADRYQPKLFALLCDEFLMLTDDPWAQLEIRRRCAGRQFALAEAHGRGLRDLDRLFNAQRKLGYSSLQDELGHLGLYARALADRGHSDRARTLIREFAERVDRLHAETASYRKAIPKIMRRLSKTKRSAGRA